MHPVETFKAITAWDDWANGHGDRALGKITGGLFLGLGSGKLLKDLVGRKHHDTDTPAEHRPGTPAGTPEARVERVQQGITDNRGNLLGVEDSKGVRLIDEAQLNQVRQHFHDNLGAPTKVYETPKGTVEFWEISTDPKQQVVYRTYSGSGGATIDINGVSGVDMKRFHIK